MFRSFTATLSAAMLGATTLLAASAAPALAGDAEAGEAQFRRCAACHQVGPDAAHRVGPHLNGIVGRAIGGVADFSGYSDELLGMSDDVWTEESLKAYILDPTTFIGGARSRMPAQRLRPEQLEDLIAYLATIPE